VWDTTTPSVCPTNHTHSIDNTTIVVDDSISTNTTKILQENKSTQGNFCSETRTVIVGPKSIALHKMSWKYPISVFGSYFNTTSGMTGDIINCYVASNTTIGVAVIPVSIGVKTFTVSSTVFDYINLGHKITICSLDGSVINDVGYCIAINKENSTIETDIVTTNTFSAPSYIQFTIHNIRNFVIDKPGKVCIAERSLAGSYIPPDTYVQITYENISNAIKSFVYHFDYFY
jgi:hypothetical protein